MKRWKIVFSLICACIMAWANCQAAIATETGSVSVTMKDNQTIVADGSLSIYCIADILVNEENYEFSYTKEWEECGVVLDNLQNADLAEELKEYAIELKLEGVTKTIGKDGTVRFEQLSDGVYLIVQKNGAEGYFPVKPFLITVPQLVDGTLIYDIDASPKVELKAHINDEEPDIPVEPTGGDPGPQLYQTGQLNWPIPVLAVSGLLLFAIGWYLCFAKKEK